MSTAIAMRYFKNALFIEKSLHILFASCVLLASCGKKTSITAASKQSIADPNVPPIPEFSEVPENLASLAKVRIGIGNVSKYKYSVVTGTTACADAEYSPEQTSSHIEFDVSDKTKFPDGGKIGVCIVTASANGKWQALDEATEVRWTNGDSQQTEQEKQKISQNKASLLSSKGKQTAALSEKLVCAIGELEKNKIQAEAAGVDAALVAQQYSLRFYFYNSRSPGAAHYIFSGALGSPSATYMFHTPQSRQPKGGSNFQRNTGVVDAVGDKLTCRIEVHKHLPTGETRTLSLSQVSDEVVVVDAPIIVATQQPQTVSGLPENSSNSENFVVTISGDSEYKFAVINGTESCSTATYSAVQTNSQISVDVSDDTVYPDGEISLCVVRKGANGTWQSPSQASETRWTKDTIQPVAADVVVSGTLPPKSNATALNMAIGGSEIEAYRYKISTTNDCSTSSGYSTEHTPVSTPITDDVSSLGDGPVYVCVLPVDAAGNIADALNSKVITWTKDTTAPTASSDAGTVPPSSSSASSVSIGVQNSDFYVYVLLGPDSPQTCSTTTYPVAASAIETATPITESLAGDGSYVLCLKGVDEVGNVQNTATSYAWVKDTTAPQGLEISLSSLPQNPSSNTSLNVGVSGVVSYLYSLTTQVTSCASATYESESFIATNITNTLSNGNLRLCVRGRDAAGNLTAPANAKVHNWVQDNNEPIASHIVLSGAPNANSNVSLLSLTVSADPSWTHSNFTHHSYSLLSDHTTPCASATYSGWTNSSSFAPTITGDGNKRLCVLVRTLSGVETSPGNAKVIDWVFDSVPPSSGDILLSDTPSATSNATSLNVTVSGVETYRFAVITQSEFCNAAIYSVSQIPVATKITSILGADADYRLCVIGSDAAGNETSVANAKTFDWTKNTTTNLAELTNTPSAFSSATSLAVTVGGSDIVSYKYALLTSGTCDSASYSPMGASNWVQIATPISEVLGTDGNYTLCVLGKNSAATEQSAEDATVYTWTKDTTAPTAAQILLANVPNGQVQTPL